MPVTVNVRHLENKNVQLEGEISAKELDFESVDELIKTNEPLRYDVEVELNGQNLLVRGQIGMTLECECARCLKPFKYPIDLNDYAALVPLEGEDKAPVVNDLVDLTPYLREDILLAFPQHPLCEAECDRLPSLKPGKQPGTSAQAEKSAWDELNKLKF
jgi:uncharacterized protein